jgi:hypothetical protein
MKTASRMQPSEHKGDNLPEREIARALTNFWNSKVLQNSNDPLAPKPTKGTLYDTVVEIDSLTVCDAIIILEQIVGFEVPITIIKKGGYKNCNEMVNHLMRGLQRCPRQKLKAGYQRKEQKHAV